jgi:amino acid adenylation domain-containing protein
MRRSILPTSPGQESIWFHARMEPALPIYNSPFLLRLRGRLDVDALGRAIQAVVDRHETLRTTFAVRAGTLVQVVAERAAADLSVVDVAEAEAEAERLVLAEARRPFDLETGPLLHATLFRLGPERHELLLVAHHAVFDAWSLDVLLRELAALYGVCAAGRPSPLPALPIQYGDFAHWQRQQLGSPAVERQRAHWKRRLAGAPPLLELPADRPRPARQTLRGAQEHVALPPRLVEAVEALGREQGCTLFMTMLAAFHTLLYRCSRQPDVLVGLAVADRPRPETAGLIGFFVSTLVLRVDLSGVPTFRALLARVREAMLDALANRDLPFEALVAELNPERSLSHAPLYQVAFALRHAAARPGQWPDLDVRLAEPFTGTSKYDLTLHLVEAGGWTATALYNTDIFDSARIQRLLGHYRTLLESAVAGPDRSPEDLPILSAAERQQVVAAWNRTGRDFPGAVSVAQLVEAQVVRTPAAEAVCFEAERLTYRELNESANRLAHLLRSRGVRPDVLVGVCLERSLEMVVALLAVLKAGGAYVPLDPELPDARLRSMLGDAGVAAVLTRADLLARLRPGANVGVFCFDRDGGLLAAQPAHDPEPAGHPDNLVYVIYTSGSTGAPKGVSVTRRGAVNLMLALDERCPLEAGAAVFQKTPFGFDGSFWEFFLPLLKGGRTVLARPGGHRDARYLVRTVDRERIVLMHLVPAMLSAFAGELGGERCRSLRWLICAGEELPPAHVRNLHERAPWLEVHNVYGPTEVSIAATGHVCRPGDRAPVGSPMANTRVYVLDERLEPVPVGVPGELCIGGVQVARGYLGQAALTAERFVPDPFGEAGGRLYRTGDLGSRLPDGELTYLDRIDRQVKIRGFRIEPGEIEAALQAHPAVAAAVVLADRTTTGERRLVGYVVPEGRAALEAGALRAFLADRLPAHMVPAAIVPLERLPLTTSGKVDRRSLPAPGAPAGAEAFVAPRTSSEELVAGVWRALLDVEAVGRDHNFFDLGGHSLLLIAAQERLEQATGREVPLTELFRHPTVLALARYLDGDGDERPPDKGERAHSRRASRGGQLDRRLALRRPRPERRSP